MKKLMILAAVVCAAVVTQAASVNWSVDGSGSSQKNKAVFVFNASDRTKIVGLLLAGTANGTAADIIANSIWTSAALTASGTQTSSASTPGVGGTFDLGNVPTGDVSYFAVVFNKTADQVGSATKYYLSADATGHSYTDLNPSEGVKAAMSIAGVTSVAIPQSIPEPTSGLLLLLGVAGLALKRKHA